MADRNIDESIRKPRRTKGTPFFKLRNYYALGALGLSAVTAIIFEVWSGSNKLRLKVQDGKFDYPVWVKEQIAERQLAAGNPRMEEVIAQLREKKE